MTHLSNKGKVSATPIDASTAAQSRPPPRSAGGPSPRCRRACSPPSRRRRSRRRRRRPSAPGATRMTAVFDTRRKGLLLGASGEPIDAARCRARDADRAKLSMRRSSGRLDTCVFCARGGSRARGRIWHAVCGRVKVMATRAERVLKYSLCAIAHHPKGRPPANLYNYGLENRRFLCWIFSGTSNRD